MAETVEMITPPTITHPVTRRISRAVLGQSKIQKFVNVCNKHADVGPFSILVAQIDPDAIGSAFGMQELLGQLGHPSQIYYAGMVSHPQNEALCNRLNLMSRMTSVKKAELVNGTLPNVVLVDSNRAQDSRMPFKVDPIIVVDHHQNSDVDDAHDKFLWLDESVGAASTLIAELLSEAAPDGWAFRADIALMLAMGIYTDCKSNTRSGERDDAAYSWVKKYANFSDLISLIRYKRPFSFLKNMARAINYIERRNTYRQARIIGCLGKIPEKQGDDLAMVGDELLRTVGAPLAITWAIIESKDRETGDVILKVRVCARNEDYTVNLADTLFGRFGRNSGAKILPDGTGEGGALFELPALGGWLKEEEMVEIIDRRIIEWFFDAEEPSNTDATS